MLLHLADVPLTEFVPAELQVLPGPLFAVGIIHGHVGRNLERQLPRWPRAVDGFAEAGQTCLLRSPLNNRAVRDDRAFIEQGGRGVALLLCLLNLLTTYVNTHRQGPSFANRPCDRHRPPPRTRRRPSTCDRTGCQSNSPAIRSLRVRAVSTSDAHRMHSSGLTRIPASASSSSCGGTHATRYEANIVQPP